MPTRSRSHASARQLTGEIARVEAAVARLRAERAKRRSQEPEPAHGLGARARADLAILDAILASYLRTVGVADARRRSTELLGLRALEAPGAGPPFTLDATEREELDRTLEGVPWLEWGARGLDELVRDFGVAHDRNAMGKFYTPSAFVSHILDHTLDRALRTVPLEALKVLEPACGSGDFAVPILERLAAAWIAAGVDPREARRRALTRNLHAVDWDPVAVVVTRIRLVARAIDSYRDGGELARPRVFHENALWDAAAPPEPGDESLELPFGDPGRRGPPRLDDGGGLLASRSPFHVIVGNPPYGGRLSASEKTWLRRRYRLARGRIDTAALFLERSLELLAPSGYLGFVLPHSLTRSGAYGPARRMLTSRLSITTLVDLGNAFPGVSFNTMIVTGTTGKAPPRVDVFRARGGDLVRNARIPRSFVNRHETLPLGVTEVGLAIFRAMEARAVPLRALARNQRGLNLPKRRQRLGRALTADSVAVVQGRDLTPFGLLDPAALPRVSASDAGSALLSEPAIGIQNVSNEIEATLLPSGMLPLDTVNVLTPTDSRVDTFFLMAMLNSSLIHAYLRDVVISHATLTVHLDDPVLGGLPIALPPDDRTRREIGNLARVLLGLAGPVPAGEARARVLAELDARVAELYGVSPDRVEARFGAGTPDDSR